MAALKAPILLVKHNHEQRIHDLNKEIATHKQHLSIQLQSQLQPQATNPLPKHPATPRASSRNRTDCSPDRKRLSVDIQAPSHHEILAMLKDRQKETEALRIECQHDVQSFQHCMQQIAQQLTGTQKILQRITMQLDVATAQHPAIIPHGFA